MTSLLQPGEAESLLKAAIEGRLPDERGRFGPFGGRYVPETLVPAFERLEAGVKEHLHDPQFQAEFQRELREWVGRPTALTHAPRLSERWGADVWLKREDLAHTGAHKINNAIGQALLAKRLGVERVIAETGAGQHGVASAAACARVGLPCAVYMGAVDIERQAPNVDRMERLGVEVFPVESGDKTLRAAIDEALSLVQSFGGLQSLHAGKGVELCRGTAGLLLARVVGVAEVVALADPVDTSLEWGLGCVEAGPGGAEDEIELLDPVERPLDLRPDCGIGLVCLPCAQWIALAHAPQRPVAVGHIVEIVFVGVVAG